MSVLCTRVFMVLSLKLNETVLDPNSYLSKKPTNNAAQGGKFTFCFSPTD